MTQPTIPSTSMLSDRRGQSVVWGFLCMLIFIAVSAGLIDVYRLYAARNWAYSVAQEAALAGVSKGRDWSSVTTSGLRLDANPGQKPGERGGDQRDDPTRRQRLQSGCACLAGPKRRINSWISITNGATGKRSGRLEQRRTGRWRVLAGAGEVVVIGWLEYWGKVGQRLCLGRGGAMRPSFLKQIWSTDIGPGFWCLVLLITFLLVVDPASAAIWPEYLKNGRTYDQETTYIQWTGSVGFVSVTHADNTSLPPSEGGAPCNPCTETVTRIYNGGSISGNFHLLADLQHPGRIER